jgi:hypothetical protein
MANPKPSLVTQTKPDNDATHDVKVVVKRTVTYVIEVRSARNLNIPYAVAVGGVVQAAFKNKPKRVNGNSGEIVVNNVDPGTQVTLFLNSDAHPSYRTNPVYAVTPGDRDAVVKIKEKSGKHSDTDAPARAKDIDPTVEAAKKADTYTAVLTGDIWMKVSHKYSSAEVDALLPSGTSTLVATTVKKIYDGLTQASLSIVVPLALPERAERTIAITFDEGENARQNISTGYDLLAEGLKRVHPAGYAAVFSAAIDAGVNKVAISSTWRPMLGSIPHRAGLGLDVNYVGATRLNREELRTKAVDTINVSPQEKTIFAAFETSKTQQSAAKKALVAANAEVRNTNGFPEKIFVAKQKLKEATEASAAAYKARKDAEVAWIAERDQNEPAVVRRFRRSLIECKCVAQLFDPWVIDFDNRDNVAATPNMQVDKNEITHADHLHITVYEPKIL